MRKEKILPAISDLPRLSAPQLQAVHQEMFGAKHPIANCQHLRRKIAWHLQAAKEGGLPESVRQYAIVIARGTELRVRISENACDRRDAIPLELSVTTKVAGQSTGCPAANAGEPDREEIQGANPGGEGARRWLRIRGSALHLA